MSICEFIDMDFKNMGIAPVRDGFNKKYFGYMRNNQLHILYTLKEDISKGEPMTIPEKIDRSLKQHENHKYCERSLDSIADYIDWAWKWKKISHEEMQSFVDRIVTLFEEEKLK